MLDKYTVILFLSLLSLGCSEDDELVNETLLGSWELVNYYNEATDEINKPPSGSDPISITFEETDFQGSTGRNNFFGDYNSELNDLSFVSFVGTEIVESEWGTLFFQTIASTYDSEEELFVMKFNIENNLLIIEYNQSRFMRFRAIR